MPATAIVPVFAEVNGEWISNSARMQWWYVDDGVRLRAEGPWGEPVTVEGTSVCGCLIGIRAELPRVLIFAQGARRHAWGSTPEYPCGVDEALLYPVIGEPPLPEPIKVLDPLPDSERDALASAAQQLQHRQNWIDNLAKESA